MSTEILPTIATKDNFQPSILIDKSLDENEEFQEIFRYARLIAGGTPRKDNSFFTDIEFNSLVYPEARFVACPNYQTSGDLILNGKRYPYVGFLRILNCNIYRNPDSPQFKDVASAIKEVVAEVETPEVSETTSDAEGVENLRKAMEAAKV